MTNANETRETLTATVNAAWTAYEAAKLTRANLPAPSLRADRSARARSLWADRAARREVRRCEANLKTARAALVAAGFAEEE